MRQSLRIIKQTIDLMPVLDLSYLTLSAGERYKSKKDFVFAGTSAKILQTTSGIGVFEENTLTPERSPSLPSLLTRRERNGARLRGNLMEETAFEMACHMRSPEAKL
jgi:hypothetical protein